MSRRSLSSPSQWPTSRLIRSTSERCQVLGGAAAVEPRRTDVRRYGGECNLFRPCRGCLAFSVFASHGLRRGLLSGAPAGAAWLFLCSPPTACAVGYFPAPLPGLPVRNRFRTFRDQELAGLSWTISLAVYRECDLNKCVKFWSSVRAGCGARPALPLLDSSRARIAVSHECAKLEDLSTEESGLGKPQACAKKAPTCRFEVEDFANIPGALAAGIVAAMLAVVGAGDSGAAQRSGNKPDAPAQVEIVQSRHPR